MPTVIDSLFVELGLDTKKFTQGQREVLDQFRRTKEQATKDAKEVEGQGKRLNDFFGTLKRQAVGLSPLYSLAAASKEFTTYITTLDANTGRLAKTLEITTDELAAWQGVARITGGDANTMAASLNNVSQQVEHFLLTGQGNFLPLLNTLEIGLFDANKNLKTTTQLFLEIARAVQGMDPGRAKALMSAIGIDPQTINTLLLGEATLKRLLTEQRQIGTATDETAKNAQELQKAWAEATLSAESLGRSLVNALNPALVASARLMTMVSNGWKFIIENFGIVGQFLGLAAPTALRLKEAPAPSAPGATPQSLRVKPGAGTASPATAALAARLQRDVQELDRFTSFNDPYHALLGRRSKHGQDLALDFTLKDPTQSAAVSAQVRQQLTQMGIDARVIDEYANPSRGATAGHIHVQFNSAEAARRYRDIAGTPQFGAPAAALGPRSQATPGGSTTVNVGNVTVNTQATDADGIARDIGPALRRNMMANALNYGQQ